MTQNKMLSLVAMIVLGVSMIHGHGFHADEDGIPDILTNKRDPMMRMRRHHDDSAFGENERDAMSYILNQNQAILHDDKYALYEGDIYQVKKKPSFEDMRIESRLWKGGIVPFTIDKSFSSQSRRRILEAMRHYRERTCIRFVPRKKQKDYLKIRALNGCWSMVGRDGGRQVLSLDQGGCIYLGTIIHEMMHALGFDHEQSRTDRDMYVDILWENIQSGEENQFEKYSHTYTDPLGAPYDYTSVMHYQSDAFSLNGDDTITPKKMPEGVNIIDRSFFSKWDLFKINKLYHCNITGLELKVLPGVGECFIEKNAKDYRGVVNTTLSGRTCEHWTAQKPHKHKYTEDRVNYPLEGLGDHNYCRNPGDRSGPWCYTMDRRKKMEYCDIGLPEMNCEAKTLATPMTPMVQENDKKAECYENQYAMDYRGSVGESRKNIPCQKWTDQFPNEHTYTASNYPYGGLGDHSYCRNPDGDVNGAWCLTVDPDEKYPLYCDVGEPSSKCKDAPGCGIEFNLDRPGKNINHGGDNKVLNREECCDLCWITTACISWTFDKRPGQTFGNCWLKNRVPSGVGGDCCDSGILEDEEGCTVHRNRVIPGYNINNGTNYKVKSNLACCNACWVSNSCLAWTFDKRRDGGHYGDCWLKDDDSIDISGMQKDKCCDSGYLGI